MPFVQVKNEPLEEVSRVTGEPVHGLKGEEGDFPTERSDPFSCRRGPPEKWLKTENTLLKGKIGSQRPAVREED